MKLAMWLFIGLLHVAAGAMCWIIDPWFGTLYVAILAVVLLIAHDDLIAEIRGKR